MDRAPNFRPVRRGKVVHVLRWTTFFETFPVGPNRSIEFWTEISGNFGWMDRAPDLTSRRSPDLLLRDSTQPRHIGIIQITPWLVHFRVPKTLTFKMRPSAQPFHSVEMSFICMRIRGGWTAVHKDSWGELSSSMKNHFNIKCWALTSFWYRSSTLFPGFSPTRPERTMGMRLTEARGTRKNGLQNGGHLKGVPFFVSLPATKTLIDEK